MVIIDRFDLYKRAHILKNKKSKSIGGEMAFDKNPFVLDWDEAIALRKKSRRLGISLKLERKLRINHPIVENKKL